jgi:DtxR family Mn-dependent transcriptional regulator
MSAPSSTVDRYLEAIYCISFEGDVVRPGHLATWLSVSPPSVSDAVQRLRRDGWIEVRHDRSIVLTPEGLTVASNLIRRHRILERWLTDGLHLDWAAADEEAEKLSSSISDQLIDRIDESLGRPHTCPHGNLIPGREAPYGELMALAEVASGSRVIVRRISEVAEHEARDFLAKLAHHGISEGSVVSLIHASPLDGDLQVAISDQTFVMSRREASLVWVEASK